MLKLRPRLSALCAPLLALAVLTTFGLTACDSPPGEVKRIGRLLDPVGRGLDQYGTVTVSSPLLVDVRSMEKRFEFDLKKSGPDDFYDIARKEVQGGLGIFSQRASDLRAGFQARVNLQDLLTNQMRLAEYAQDLADFKRRGALQDSGVLLNLLLPLIDPELALVPLDPDDLAEDDDTVGEDDEREELTPEQEEVARLKALIAALGGASAGVSGATSRPAIPEFAHNPPAIDPSVLPENKLAELVLSDQKFNQFMGLIEKLGAGTPTNQNRSAIITAAGDTTVEAIMSFLGRPLADKEAAEWRDKVVLMGVSMVSVAPGTQTARGYVADVAVTCQLDYRPVRRQVWDKLLKSQRVELERLQEAAVELINERSKQTHDGKAKETRAVSPVYLAGGEAEYTDLYDLVYDPESNVPELTPTRLRSDGLHPVVSATSPMTDAQVLDTATSIRSQQAFALRLAIVLAGFGADAQAQSLFQSIDRLEQDARTRTTFNTVAAYSNAGGVFGYQIGPSLVGAADFIPTRRRGGLLGLLEAVILGEVVPGPDLVLQRQSFPVAVFVGLNRQNLGLKLAADRSRKGVPRYFYVEPALKFEQTVRWIPMQPPRTDPFAAQPQGISESERLEWAWRLQEARKAAHGLNEQDDVRNYVESRAEVMRSQSVLATSWQTLPYELIVDSEYPEPRPAAGPVVTGASPNVLQFLLAKGAKNEPLEAEVVVLGRGLNQVQAIEITPAAGVQILSTNVGKPECANGIVARIRWDLPDARTPSTYTLKLTHPGGVLFAPPIQVLPAPQASPGPAPAPVAAGDPKITRETTVATASQPAQTHTETLTISKGMSESLARAILAPASQPANVDVDVDVDVEATEDEP